MSRCRAGCLRGRVGLRKPNPRERRGHQSRGERPQEPKVGSAGDQPAVVSSDASGRGGRRLPPGDKPERMGAGVMKSVFLGETITNPVPMSDRGDDGSSVARLRHRLQAPPGAAAPTGPQPDSPIAHAPYGDADTMTLGRLGSRPPPRPTACPGDRRTLVRGRIDAARGT